MRLPHIKYDKWHLGEQLLHLTESRSKKALFKDALR
jgi:hypothetical protein